MTKPWFCDRFDSVVDRHGEHTAIEFDGSVAYTYQGLSDHSKTIQSCLRRSEIEAGGVIAIDVGKTPAYVASLIGVWRAGLVALPIAAGLPPKLKQSVIEQSHASAIMTLSNQKEIVFERIAEHQEKSQAETVPAERDAYLFFTSGSTGQPKGVVVTHRGIVPMLEDQIQAFALNETTRSLFYLSIAFDASLSDIGTALLCGGTLVFESDLDRLGMSELFDRIADRTITYADLPPSIMTRAAKQRIDCPPSLETVIIGGEVCPAATVDWWADRLRLINVYGPTEATVCTSVVMCRPGERTSIGDPIAGIRYTTQNDELWISGPGLARKYLGNRSLTTSKFITIDGKRWYRTGDRVSQDPEGKFFYEGRLDEQFKLLGKLIEPQHVRTVILQLDWVEEVVVLPRRDADGLVVGISVFVQSPETTDLGEQQIRAHCQECLPGWMQPNAIRIIDRIPRTPTGKIDGSRLPTQENVGVCDDSSLVRHGPMLPMLTKILGHDQFKDEDDFFSAGGNSLAAMELIATASQAGYSLSLTDLADRKLGEIVFSAEASSFMTTCQLDDIVDARLRDFKPFPQMKKRSSQRMLLVTGATGFLGTWFIQQWRQRYGMPLVCLVRAETPQHALRRINESRRRYVDEQDNDLAGGDLEVVCGDVSKPNFGWRDLEWKRQCERITDVVHLAAEVHLLKAFNDLRKVNFDSLEDLVRFSNAGIPKRFALASTLSVFASSNHPASVHHETDPLDGEYELFGGYAQSKWIAERAVSKLSNQCDTLIARLGLLTGSTLNGQSSLSDQLAMATRGLVSLGVYPRFKNDAAFDVTPVDQAAAILAELIGNECSDVFHLGNRVSVTLEHWAETLNRLGHRCKQVSVNAFEKRLASQLSDRATPELAATHLAFQHRINIEKGLQSQAQSTDLFLSTQRRFDSSRLADRFPEEGVSIAEPTDEYLNLIVRRMLEQRKEAS